MSFPRIAQKFAEKQAVRLSGITTVEGERMWKELLRGGNIWKCMEEAFSSIGHQAK